MESFQRMRGKVRCSDSRNGKILDEISFYPGPQNTCLVVLRNFIYIFFSAFWPRIFTAVARNPLGIFLKFGTFRNIIFCYSLGQVR